MTRPSTLLVALALGAALVPCLPAQVDRLTGKPFSTRSEVIAPHGMVCTSHPLATQIGLDVLKAGGSAVDAAIAANAALGLMEPVSNGIGGDLFAIVWDAKTQKLHGLNASGRSPLGLSYDQMQAELKKIGTPTIPPHGFLPVSVPGCVDGWFELHAKFGRRPMAELLAPTIAYAENGHPVAELIQYYWARSVPILSKQPGGFKDTFTINGRAPEKGEMFKNPDLARSLRLLAEKGRDAFYKGEIADKVDAFMRSAGGWLRKEDFARHKSDWVEPVGVNYRGYDVFELPPNSQGIAALQMLNLLEAYDLKAMGWNSPEALHLLIEAKKLAFEDRAKFYADPDFSKIPLRWLVSKEYAAERRKLIDPKRAARRVDAGNPKLNEGDTIYMTVADRDGSMISLIQSNYRGMGSGIVTPGTGFGFQDRGEMFTFEKGHANVYAPGKRPFQTIIPAFVMKDGKPWMSFGVMGGAMQPQGHVQILCNIIDWGMDLQAAGDAARWQHLGSSEPTSEPPMTNGGYVEVESGIPWESVRGLLDRGHQVRVGHGGFGGYQAIMRDHRHGVWIGASESRKDGQSAGY